VGGLSFHGVTRRDSGEEMSRTDNRSGGERPFAREAPNERLGCRTEPGEGVEDGRILLVAEAGLRGGVKREGEGGGSVTRCLVCCRRGALLTLDECRRGVLAIDCCRRGAVRLDGVLLPPAGTKGYGFGGGDQPWSTRAFFTACAWLRVSG